jgi:hypothetical protein
VAIVGRRGESKFELEWKRRRKGKLKLKLKLAKLKMADVIAKAWRGNQLSSTATYIRVRVIETEQVL